MPQRAKIDGENIHAFAVMSDDEWSALIRASDDSTLTMPCCGVRAVCKMSSRGRRFFSHPPNSLFGCDAALETERHEEIKIAIAKAISNLSGWNLETESRCDILCDYDGEEIRIGIEIELPKWGSPEIYCNRDKGLRANGITPLWLIGRYCVEDFPALDNRFELQYRPREATIADAERIVVGYLKSISERINLAKELMKFLNSEGYDANVETSLSIPTIITGQRTSDFVRIDLSERVFQFSFDKTWMELDGTRRRAKNTFDAAQAKFWQFRVHGHGMPKEKFEKHKKDVIERSRETERSSQDAGNIANVRSHFKMPSYPNSWEKNNDDYLATYGKLRTRMVRDVALKVMTNDEVETWMITPNPALNGMTPVELAEYDSNAVFEVEVHLGLRDRKTHRPI